MSACFFVENFICDLNIDQLNGFWIYHKKNILQFFLSKENL